MERNINNKNNLCINGAFDFSNFNKDTSLNDNSPLNNIKNNNFNIIPINKRKSSKNKIDLTNSSFLALRKNSDFSPKKRNDNSITLNENNINIISLSNLSNTNLINNKNESLFKNMNLKENIKDVNESKEKDKTINQINNIYDNNFQLKLKLNKDEINPQKKISNKYINRRYEKKKYFQIIKKNHYTLLKSKTLNQGKSFNLNKNNSSKILQLFCFICNNYDERLYHARNCKHFFCGPCGKIYFEQKVKQGIYTLKCPKYKCNNFLNLNSVKAILSRETYSKLDTYQKINNNINKLTLIKTNEKFLQNINTPKSNKRNSFETISNESYKGLNCFKKNFLKIPNDKKIKNNNKDFVQRTKHILKIDDSPGFKHRLKMENERNEIICSKCKEPSLFKRDGLSYIKCLNCDNIICKYCLKKFNNYKKFNRRNLICSVCVLRKKKRKNRTALTKMKYEIFLIFSGFFAVIIGFSKYEVEFILKNKRKCFILYVVMYIIIFVFNFVIAILLYPYFPVITMIFG